MAKELYGKIDYYTSSSGIVFSFREIPKKDLIRDKEEVTYYSETDLPFLIWQMAKGNKVKITIEKIKD